MNKYKSEWLEELFGCSEVRIVHIGQFYKQLGDLRMLIRGIIYVFNLYEYVLFICTAE